MQLPAGVRGEAGYTARVPSARERILDAYEELLATDGERHATMDAVAQRAGVSKGGLIYHFPSKEKMVDAVCDRLTELVANDVEQMRSSDEGAARYYIRTSYYEGTPLDRAMVAVSRLLQSEYPRARQTYDAMGKAWQQALIDDLGDPAIARTVKLVGDGLYYDAMFTAGGDPAMAARRHSDADTAAVLAVVDRITGR